MARELYFQHAYPVSALARVLDISRSAIYYEAVSSSEEAVAEKREVQKEIEISHKESGESYGTRKIKKDLAAKGYQVSRRYISRVMKDKELASTYTRKSYRPQKGKTNESLVSNTLDRKYDGRKPYEVVVSDLTYVQVRFIWYYICILIDLFNREIIGYSIGSKHDSSLVMKAFYTVRTDLSRISLFHSDRGSEFTGKKLNTLLDTFGIRRSLSQKGCPYDNAVAEATFKSIKTEFVRGRVFDSEEELKNCFDEYVYWYNHLRRHGALGYESPVSYRRAYEEANREKSNIIF